MAKQPEHETHPAPRETETAPPPAKPGWMIALGHIGHHALHALTPALAVLALAVAAITLVDNRASHAQLAAATAKIDSLNASLDATHKEAEQLKAALAQDKAERLEDRKKRDLQVMEIVQGLSKAQTKLKIFPTIDELFYVPPPSERAAAPPDTSMPVDQMQAIQEAIKKLNNTRKK